MKLESDLAKKNPPLKPKSRNNQVQPLQTSIEVSHSFTYLIVAWYFDTCTGTEPDSVWKCCLKLQWKDNLARRLVNRSRTCHHSRLPTTNRLKLGNGA